MSGDHSVSNEQYWNNLNVNSRYKGGEKIGGPVALALLEQSGVIEAAKSGVPVKLLDNACGTGIVTSTFHAIAGGAASGFEVTCADFSEAMLNISRERAKTEGWKNTDFKIADAQDTKLQSGHYTHILTSMGFGIFPKSDAALDELERMLASGGTTGFTTWHYAGWPSLISRGLQLAGSSYVFSSMLASYKARTGYDWSSVEEIETLLKSRGYSEVKVNKVPTFPKFSKEEIASGETGRILVNIAVSMVGEEDVKSVLKEKVLPALAANWDDMFSESEGMYTMEMTAIVATAKKAA
ncbi:S-adenosyl-L-methionine-dependent methyltransferase [Auricularia subglabra TFB-10046 SS5]|nr:S-adenosyl-L-methionine-dependent methyltransferase [Auricularia subglabra TFB-10046 SS5]